MCIVFNGFYRLINIKRIRDSASDCHKKLLEYLNAQGTATRLPKFTNQFSCLFVFICGIYIVRVDEHISIDEARIRVGGHAIRPGSI